MARLGERDLPEEREDPSAALERYAMDLNENAAARWPEPFTLELRGVRLRPSCAGDAAQLFPHIHRADKVIEWICWDGPETLSDLVDRYVSWRLASPAEPIFVFVFERVRDGAVIGEGTLRFDGHPGVADLGYWLGAEFHGSGLGGAAVELLTRAAFERCGAHSATAKIMEGNEASLAALRRTGFQLDRLPGRRDPKNVGDAEGSSAANRPSSDRQLAWVASLTKRGYAKRKSD